MPTLDCTIQSFRRWIAMAQRNRNRTQQRIARELEAVDVYQRHFGSTTQREGAAAELGLDLLAFLVLLEGARRLGVDIEARP